MSFHRFIHMAGWAAVILLTIVGFAAFNTSAPRAGEVRSEAILTTSEAPDPAPATTAASPSSSVELETGWLDSVAFREMVNARFAASDVNQAVRLAWCLSRFDADAIDPSTGAVGLFQIDPIDWSTAVADMGLPADADPFDPAVNVAVAAHIVYGGSGWGYWSCV
ncbi:hypothetical protein BH18ACT6_BH18ACT6_01960 [soil metagenome]